MTDAPHSTLPLPADVLFDDEPSSVGLPVCDHYAGSEKLMRKSLALQAARGPVFDITLDCEDGAQVGCEREHAELVATLLASAENRHGRVGVRIHGGRHAAWRQDVDIIVRDGARSPAYVTLPKIDSAAQAETMCAYIETARRAAGFGRPVPVQVLVETHGALAEVRALAALPQVEALSFGLMDFVSAHHGAIPDGAMRSPGQFTHPLVARAKAEIAAACHACGKVPSHNVTTDVRDPAVAGADARRARDEFGYTRMWSVHPAQIEPIVDAFAPDAEEIALATAILLQARGHAWGPTRHGHTLHDRASYRYYWFVLRRAALAGRALSPAAAGLVGDLTRPSGPEQP
jgi:citrate lyase subunit beta/citryl-CoA lyase